MQVDIHTVLTAIGVLASAYAAIQSNSAKTTMLETKAAILELKLWVTNNFEPKKNTQKDT
jgi:hypothetical protein